MNALTAMTYALLVGAAMSAVGLCLEQVMVAMHRPRRWAWCFTIAVSVLLPLGALAFPRTAVVPSFRAAAPVPSRTLTELARTTGLPPLTMERPSNNVSDEPAALRQSAAMNRVGLALLSGSLLVVPALLSVQWLQLRARRRHWHDAVLDSSPVLVSEDFGPAVIGAFSPRIVVPLYIFALAPAQQRLVMSHEQEHVRARDGQLSLAMILFVALAPWNLLLWWQYVRLRVAIEVDCDARVLDRGAPANAYGSLLLDMAERTMKRPPIASVLTEHFSGSVRQRIESIGARTRPASRMRAVAVSTIAAGIMAVLVLLPRPAVSQRALPAHDGDESTAIAQDDSTAIQIMHLNRAGHYADAERVGTARLGARASIQGNGAACAVLIGVTFAQARQDKRDAASASMQRFDRECAGAVFIDFFPGEANRVRRLVAGESFESIRRSTSQYAVTDSGATDVMMLNRAGRHAEVEQIGSAFLAKHAQAERKPEACAVLISVTHAQHAQGKIDLAKASLQRFDSECANIAYMDWFPGESDRVRRRIGSGSR